MKKINHLNQNHTLKPFLRACLLMGVLAAMFLSTKTSATPPPGYYLVWSDEFNGNGLDLSKWYYFNQISQNAQDTLDTITETNGALTINTYTTNGINYSGIIGSYFRPFYGYYESSISFCDSNATWSGFWLQSPNEGQHIGDPSSSGAEIDMAEHRYVDVNTNIINDSVQETLHWDGYANNEQTVNPGQEGSGLSSGFHTISLLWTTSDYKYGIDGTTFLSTNIGHSDRTEVIQYSSQVQSPSWAGIIPPGGYGPPGASAVKMSVDYFRYYAPSQMIFWTGNASADWTDTNNWFAGMTATATNDVVFNELSAANFNIPLAQPTTVHSLAFQETPPVNIYGAPLTITGGINTYSAVYNTTIGSTVILGADQSWNTGTGLQLTTTGPINGPGQLTIAGWGTVAIAGTNNVTTYVHGGQLNVSGTMANSVFMTGGILTGTGLYAGYVQASGGTILANLGSPLVISNDLSIVGGGSATFGVDATAGTSGEIVGIHSAGFGGSLILNNVSGPFAVTNRFKLFDARSYAGSFYSISPSVPGYLLAWDTSTLTNDGTLRIRATAPILTTNVYESRSGNSTTGANSPAFSYVGFSSTISATFSTAVGCTATSSRYSNTAQPTTAFTVSPSLLVGPTYQVDVTWGRNTGTSMEATQILIAPTAGGVSATTFPATTGAFSSGTGNVTNSIWSNIGTITPNTTSPTVTFTYVSGMGTGRFYATAVRFISVLPQPGTMAAGMVNGTNLMINWSGNFTLQSATNVAGPYTDVPGPVVAGPYTYNMTGTQQYFRLRQ